MRKLLLIVLMTVSAAASAQSLERMTWFNEPSEWTVKDGRLTMQVTPQSDYWRISHYGFTVMSFDVEMSKVLTYMGTKSGRDGNKAAALGLHTAYTENGTPYYTEATMVIECKKMYEAEFNPKGFKDVPQKMYANFPTGLHTEYAGEVVGAWVKE